jgi:hypothetical protein
MRPRPRCLARLTPLPLLLLAIGCEEPRHVETNPTAATAPKANANPNPTPPPVQTREVLGKRTQDIRNADVELKTGARVGSTRITAKDPITLPGNAYVSIVGRNSILNIEHALDLYNAEHGQYPKDFEEFKTEIIKANNIALPTLPYYQEYGYEPKEHKLIILEYPDRKEQLQKQDDAKYGR